VRTPEPISRLRSAIGGLSAGLALVFANGAIASSAAAELLPVSQVRSADFSWTTDQGTYLCLPPPTGCSPIDVTHDEDQGDDQAPDLGAWSTSLGGIVSIDSSALGSTGFTASASHAGSGGADFWWTGEPLEAYASATYMDSHASFFYEFSVDEPTPFRLSGSLETGGAGLIGWMLARIRMTGEGPGGPGSVELLNVELTGDPGCYEPACLYLGPEAVELAGTLLPGTYTVEADLHGEGHPLISITTGVAASNDYEGSFELELTTVVAVPAVGVPGLVVLAVALLGCGRRLLV